MFRIFVILFFPLACLANQVCDDAYIASRFTDNNDGTVTDKNTGLMWKKCAEGRTGQQCDIGSNTQLSWNNSLSMINKINTTSGYAGYYDWRLPNFKELLSLTDEHCDSPATSILIFPNGATSNNAATYWSSTPFYKKDDNRMMIKVVNFIYGDDISFSPTDKQSIRMVRNW